jgi:hypothetical protein
LQRTHRYGSVDDEDGHANFDDRSGNMGDRVIDDKPGGGTGNPLGGQILNGDEFH